MSQNQSGKRQSELTAGYSSVPVNISEQNVSPKDQHNIDQAFVFQGHLRNLDATSPKAFEFIVNK